MSQYHSDKIDYTLNHDEKFVPSLTFMRHIMSGYNKIEKLEFAEVEETLKEAEKVIPELERYKIIF